MTSPAASRTAAAATAAGSSFGLAQARIATAAARAVIREWRKIDAKALDRSWMTILPRLLLILTAAQRKAASGAQGYVARALRAQGALPSPGHTLVPAPFGGVASDGRSLGGLLYTPVAESKHLIGQGTPIPEAINQAGTHLAVLAKTEVADTSRMAVQTAMAADETVRGYVRVVHLPACARCLILANRFYRYSKGFERHPNCLPAGTVVDGPQALAATRRQYEGDLVVLTTASGKELAVTVNHPVLTDRGWLPAHLISEGSDVVRSLGAQSAVDVPREHQVPALIEDVWRSHLMLGEGLVPDGPENFHGDGGQGQVHVVYADRLLRDSFAPALGKEFEQVPLAVRDEGAGLAGFDALSALEPCLGAGDPGGPGLHLAGRHLRGPGHASLGAVTDATAAVLDAMFDDVAADAIAPGDAAQGLTSKVGGLDLLHRQAGVVLAPHWDAPGAYRTVESHQGYASRGMDLLRRLTAQVELDRVVKKRRIGWSGHVFNLTSAEGWFAANGLILSNCDCGMIPARDEDWVETPDPEKLLAQMRSDHPERLRKSLTEGDLKALNEGADLNQVVNAHRGMATAAGRKLTTAGATRRGVAGKRLRGGSRMTPAQIFDDAAAGNWPRQRVVAELMRGGFIL